LWGKKEKKKKRKLGAWDAVGVKTWARLFVFAGIAIKAITMVLIRSLL
jgi:hypothetical protein